ncbi:hypothetical protein DK419_22880 [Methylobacterium terrae]|uniref:LCCL domain-containing protein n=1 Tax=Methylobacterium terrae TaxID=2202827 RepID=A0A2U8WRE1_9HYPH|nr:LCCL domain-containing protein [Methylobacterium terrae]AWN48845.1 hypothetical protein DK419_22880 [Methylobacterium terrae]
MRLRATVLSLALVAALPLRPAVAQSSLEQVARDAAYERALFRTLALLHQAAPRQTIAAATRCAVAATTSFPDGFKSTVIDIDRRPIYRASDRLSALVDALAALAPATTQPLVICIDGVGRGTFGETRGSILATAAPKPDNVDACPVFMDKVTESAVSCYCAPMTGGITYGNKTYADTSSICLAARHAGAVDYLTGGVVMAFFEPGCSSYEGIEANGALSAATGRTARSFHFPKTGKGQCPP